MHQFRRLEVWNDAVELAVQVYELTSAYPIGEQFGLTGQLRRAAVSVSSNIAEGAGREAPKEMARFLRMAIGSICEIESQVEVSRRLGYVNDVQEFSLRIGVLKARIAALRQHVLTAS